MTGSVYIPVENSSQLRLDHLDCLRGEGRVSANIGVGLSMLGYNVYLGNVWWEERSVSSNLHYIKGPSPDVYDFAFCYCGFSAIDAVHARKYVLMCFADHCDSAIEFIQRHNLSADQVVICISQWSYYEMVRDSFQPYVTKYLPPVFPIPDFSNKFIDFTYIPPDEEIKLYSQISVNEEVLDVSVHLIDDVLNAMTSMGYKPQLYLQTSDIAKFQGLNGIHHIGHHVPYDVMYSNILRADMGIVFFLGSSESGAQYDFISLGKPILGFIPCHTDFAYSPLLRCKDRIFEHRDGLFDAGKLIEYIQMTIESPFDSYSCFREQMATYEFEAWKELACAVFA